MVSLPIGKYCASFNIPNTKSWRTGKADQSSPPLLLLFLLLPSSLRPCRQDGRLNIMLPFGIFLFQSRHLFDQAMTKVEKVKGGKKVRPFYPVKRTNRSRFKGTKRNVSFCFAKFSVVAEGRERRLYLLLLFKGGSAYPSPWMQSLRVRCLCLFGGVEVVVWRRGEVWEVETGRPERS